MDPFTAIGLASNVLQFVDFASKLISATRTLYVTGSRAENVELENLAQDLRQRAEKASPPVTLDELSNSEESRALKDLSLQCRKVADELLQVFQSLKVEGDHKKWKSFHQALRSVWKQGDIEALQLRLDRIGNQMGTQILLEQQMKVLEKLASLEKDYRNLQADRNKHLTEIKVSFNDAFKLMRTASYEDFAENGALVHLSASAQKGTEFFTKQTELGILNSLYFQTMEDRHYTIRSAHPETFRWMLENPASDGSAPPSTDFVQWLRSDESLYWVSGKPGSGKSTLMKFLCSHQTTKIELTTWAQGCKLTIANFFFWNAGRGLLQKSQDGLLRSILFQVLRQNSLLVPYAFPARWKAFMSSLDQSEYGRGPPYTRQELLTAFEHIVLWTEELNIRICLFIDGLDEYDGNPNDIIELVTTINTSSHVKLCVSSRPWNQFEKVFGQDRTTKVYMQNLTRGDIQLYVQDTLEKDPSFQDLMEEDDTSMDLVRDVVNSAKGVFLWVYLVVQSLLEGLTNADRIIDLQRRLLDLPTDLNEYFERILSTVDERYRQQTAFMFQVTLKAQQCLPLMTYWFIDQENPNLGMEHEIKPMTLQQSTYRLDQMHKRLNARCKGLLEVQTFELGGLQDSLPSSVLFLWRVDFLHRTARDFLIIPEMQHLLDVWAGEKFDSDITICNAMLAQIKSSPNDEEYFEEKGPIMNIAELFRKHAECLEKDESTSVRATVQQLSSELQRTLAHHQSAHTQHEDISDGQQDVPVNRASRLDATISSPDTSVCSPQKKASAWRRFKVKASNSMR